MIKKLALIFIASLLVSAAEIYYINSSPLLDEVELEDLMVDYGKIEPLNVSSQRNYGFMTMKGAYDYDSYYKQSNDLWKELYEKRPRRRDPLKSNYKLTVMSHAILEVMKDGVLLWKMGIFKPGCGFQGNISDPVNRAKFISKHAPRALKSDFHPRASLYITGSHIYDDPYLKGWGYGRKFLLMPYGWFILSEMTGMNSFLLFDDRFPCNMNISHQDFLEGYAEFHRVMFARLSFVESVIDEKPPWRGIYYLAYYPYFNKTWIVVKSIPEKEVRDCRILIDDVEAGREVMYPFIFVDTILDEGIHRLDLVTSSTTYSTNFDVDLSPLRVSTPSVALRANGNLSFTIVNIGLDNQTIFLKNAIIDLNTSRVKKDIDKEITPYHSTYVDVILPDKLDREEYYEATISINYVVDNQVKKYKTEIRGMVEG
ncbi:MAG: hypothetical protein DRO89_04330 [Candidatus Altiarchaeales archaeon]|nr:MAG: hypothetical protein DRO89_04330 [Candidatus Altiarchaeales archaeon]